MRFLLSLSLSLLWEKCEQKSFDRWGTSNFVQFREMFQLPFIRIHVTFSSSPTHFVQLSLCPSVSFCLETKSERSSCFVSKRKKKNKNREFSFIFLYFREKNYVDSLRVRNLRRRELLKRAIFDLARRFVCVARMFLCVVGRFTC